MSRCHLHTTTLATYRCRACDVSVCRGCLQRAFVGSCAACAAAVREALHCRRCKRFIGEARALDERGICAGCWQWRVQEAARPRTPGDPVEGPLATLLFVTLEGVARQAALREKRVPLAAVDRLLLACADGRTVFEVGSAMGLAPAEYLPLVEANRERAMIELAPAFVQDVSAPAGDPALAPTLTDGHLAPALGGRKGA